MPRRPALLALCVIGLLLVPMPAWADNCATLADCYATSQAFVASTVAVAVVVTALTIGMNLPGRGAGQPGEAKDADEALDYTRPSGFRKGVRQRVWEDAVDPSTDRVRDSVTGRFMSKDNKWDMGHQPGYEFHKHQRDAAERRISRKQYLDEHNEPSHYRPELPSSNRSHRGEDRTDEYLGP